MILLKLIEQSTFMKAKTYNFLVSVICFGLSSLFSLNTINGISMKHSSDFGLYQVDAGDDQEICIGESTQLEATGATSYTWIPSTGLSCTQCPNPIASPIFTTTYFVLGDDNTIDSVKITVLSNPEILSTDFSNPTNCTLANGTISITAQGQSALEYSINGGSTWQADGNFASLAEGAYQVIVRNMGGACQVIGPEITLESPNGPIILDVIKADPSDCDESDGSITIVTSGGTPPLEYSIDGGQNWQPFPNFQQLGSGIYTVHARNSNGSCEADGDPVVLSASNDEAIIQGFNIVPPSNCNMNDGELEILIANNPNDFEFSINGGLNYQPSPLFEDIGEGLFDVFVRKLDGTCKVGGGIVEVTSELRPNLNGYSVLDPTFCGAENGIINIFAAGMGDIEYSINGGVAWQPASMFTGLAPGSYQTFIRNADGACLTAGETIQLTEPAGPSFENVFLTHPSDCGQENGVITIITNNGFSLDFSINNGNSWSANPTFSGLLAGAYDIVVAIDEQHCPIDTQVILSNPGSCIDTFSVNVLENTNTIICLDNTVLESSLPITSATICNAGSVTTVFATDITEECVSLEPAMDFIGLSPDVICVIQCYNNSSTQCDTTFIQVFVEEVIECEVFSVDTLEIDYLGNPTGYCVPVPVASLEGFVLNFQGLPFDDPVMCSPDQTFAYSYGALVGGGFDGPYTITAWDIGGVDFSGTFIDPFELVDLMNSIDPSGFWQINTQSSIIYGGNPNLQYGNMAVTHDNSGIPFVLVANFSPQAEGFQIELENPDEHILIATDTLTGCSDTLIINAIFNQPLPETVILNTSVNTPTPSYCVNGAELPGAIIQSIAFCGDATFGNVTISNDSCVVYTPNQDFAGQDNFCVIACENSNPAICDTTFFVVNVMPEIDTVYLEIASGNSSIDSCLSTSVIELPGQIEQVSFCEIDNNEIDGSINNNCVSFTAEPGFIGTSEVCAVFCSAGICDTTWVIVTVFPPLDCEPIFNEEMVNISAPLDFIDFCLPIPLNEIINYDVELDGLPFNGFAGCDYQDIVIYNYSAWPNIPFTLDAWFENGDVNVGAFNDFSTLVDSMNVWDPSGNWELDIQTTTIKGGDENSSYGNLTISDITVGVLEMTPDLVNMPLGSSLFLSDFGVHEIIIFWDIDCSDTLNINFQEHTTTTETLFFETGINTPIDPICTNASELLGAVVDISLCDLPLNGIVTIISDTCVSYQPNIDFFGPDEFCLVICDDNIPAVCDTFQVVIDVNIELPTDTLFIQTNEVLPFDTCLTSQFLQLPTAVDTAWICDSNPNEVELELLNECVTIDIVNGFSGITTACLIHCTNSDPPICDTTYLVIEVDSTISCDDIFDPDQIVVILENNIGEACLPIPLSEIGLFDVELDGTLYTNGFSGCDIDTVFEYPYLPSFGQGTLSPYTITWMLNGIMMSGSVNNAAELVDLMNTWDPAGDWTLNATNFRIVSSNQSGDYGLLTITNTVGFTENIDPITGLNPLGTLVNFSGEGQHEIVLFDPATGCDDTLFINAIDPSNFIQIITIEDTPSDETCIDTTGLPGIFQETTICSDALFGTLTISGNCFIYTPNTGFVGEDEACLEICDDQGNCESWIVQITVLPVCSQFDFFTNDILEIEAIDCASHTSVCLPIEFDSLANFGFLDNGVPISNFDTCNTSFAEIQLDTGFHEIILVHLMTQCMDTLYLNISCQTNSGCGFGAISDLNMATIECDEPLEFCVEVPFADLTNFMVTDNGVSPSQIGACSSDAQFVGVELDTGMHVLIFADTVKGCADTFLVNIDCIICPDFFPNDELFAITSCENDSTLVCLPMDADQFVNLVFDLNGVDVSNELIACGFDSSFTLVYSDLPNQGLVGPYEILEWTINGVLFTGQFNNADELADSMNIWDSNPNWTVDIVPPGDILITGGTGGNDYGQIIVEQTVTGIIDTIEIQVDLTPVQYGLEFPVGFSTLTVTDVSNGCAETVIAEVACVSVDVVDDTVMVGAADSYELNLSELIGNVNSVVNICEDASGTNVAFEIVGTTIQFSGIAEGIDTACIVICDDLNICDTTILIVTALPDNTDTTIIAVNDEIIAGEGQVTLIDVMQNDQFGSLTDFYIVSPPANGQVAFLPNGSINYVPDQGYCDDDVPDIFEYAICNSFGCDTAQVTVFVTCENLQIFNAFSPNSDNRNDFFRIKGLQNYPSHIVYVYNRWGNLVFEATNYQNNWNGVWEGRDLPDGTYFYMIDLGNGDKPLSGYVQIRR